MEELRKIRQQYSNPSIKQLMAEPLTGLCLFRRIYCCDSRWWLCCFRPEQCNRHAVAKSITDLWLAPPHHPQLRFRFFNVHIVRPRKTPCHQKATRRGRVNDEEIFHRIGLSGSIDNSGVSVLQPYVSNPTLLGSDAMITWCSSSLSLQAWPASWVNLSTFNAFSIDFTCNF